MSDLDFYYIPRSPLNPHGTYAIVAVEDMTVEPASRHHLAEISGFGDGSPSSRKVPDQVRLFCAAPDMLEFIRRIAKRDPVFAKGHEKQVIKDAAALVAKAEPLP